MRQWSFAFSRRWLGYLAFTVVFAVACALLGSWQWSRSQERSAAVELVERNWDAAPVPIDDVLPSLDRFDASDAWRPVVVSGEYLPDEQLLVRSRPRDGQPGFEVLTPLQLDDGRVFVVDRGWLPTGSEGDSPDAVPSPPSGDVTVTARLKASEPPIAGRGAPEGQIATIQLDRVAELVGEPTFTGAYGLLADERPAPATAPLPATRPDPDLGSHLSYAFQWFVFGVLGFVGLAWAVRQERRALAAERGEALPVARSRGRSDADEEDAILDSARG